MIHKLVNKTILISIIVLLILGTAITGTALLLKQSGEVATTGKEHITTATQIVQNVEDNKTVEYTNQEEPEPTTIEREKMVSETIILGWNKLDLNSVISENELEINYNNLEYKVEYYFDGVLDEETSVIIDGNSKGKVIDSYEEKVKEGYKLDKVENLPLTITENQEENVIKVYYEKASYDYTIYYYKDSITGENFLGRIPETAEIESKIIADTTKFIPKEGYVFEGTAPSMTICADSTKNILNVIYTKVNNLSYTINYLEKGTNKLLKTETVSNQEFNKIIAMADLEIPNTITANSKEYTYSNKFTTAQEPPVTGQITIGTNLSLNVINLYYERPEIKTEKTSTVITNATQPGKAYPGDEITYTIKAWNEGSGSKKVKIEDKEPNGTTIVPNSESKNSGNVSIKNGRITWIVNVPENTSKENAKVLTFKVKINDNATGKIKNTADVDGKTGPNDGDGYDIIKPANITVSKESKVIDTNGNGILEYGEKIQYTIKASNSGDDTGNVTFKDNGLKENIDSKLVTLIEKTGYTGTNQELIDALAENGVSLTVKGGKTAKITYTVEVLAKVGTTISNKVEVTSGGIVDKEKEEATNNVEKTVAITENTETIKGKNIVIVIDLSASMNDIINGTSKIEAAKDAAQQFISKIFEKDPNGENGTQVSLVTFNFSEEEKDNYRTETDKKYVGTKVFTYGNNKTIVTNKADAQAINSEIEKIELKSNLGTNIGAGLIKAQQQINVLKASNENNGNVIIFLGDGNPEAGGTENTETAINNKSTEIKKAGTEIYTIGFGLQQEMEQYCCYSGLLSEFDCELNIPKSEHTTSNLLWATSYYHKTMVYEEDAIRILRNMASGETSTEKDQYAKSSTSAQSLIDTFNAISRSIAISERNYNSSNGKVRLPDTIYADSEHQITIKVNGIVDTTLNALPTDATGKVIKEDGKYYLDLTKFDADANISVTYFCK